MLSRCYELAVKTYTFTFKWKRHNSDKKFTMMTTNLFLCMLDILCHRLMARLPMESVFDVQPPATYSCKVSRPLLSTTERGQASTYHVFN